MDDVRIQCGAMADIDRVRMAEVIDDAFGPSLAAFLPERNARLRVLADGVNRSAIIGGYLDGRLSGVIGLKTEASSVFDTMRFGLLRRELGAGAIRARLAIELLDRPLEPGTIRIEFVAVDGGARGHGVARHMLGAVAQYACAAGMSYLELSVEPDKVEAQRLYQRAGFEFSQPAAESRLRRVLAPQTDRRMIKELMCTTS